MTNILAELRSIEDKRGASGKFVVELPNSNSKPASAAGSSKKSAEGAVGDDGEGDESDEAEVETYEPPKGQELLAGLLEDNFEICEDISARDREEAVGRGPLQPIYDRLSELRAQLERLVLTHRWTLRETVSGRISACELL